MIHALTRCFSRQLVISSQTAQTAVRRCAQKKIPASVFHSQARNFGVMAPAKTFTVSVGTQKRVQCQLGSEEVEVAARPVINPQAQPVKRGRGEVFLRARSRYLTESDDAALLFLSLLNKDAFSRIYSCYTDKLKTLEVVKRGNEKHFENEVRRLSEEVHVYKKEWNELGFKFVESLANCFCKTEELHANKNFSHRDDILKLAATFSVLFSCRSKSSDFLRLSQAQCDDLRMLLMRAIKLSSIEEIVAPEAYAPIRSSVVVYVTDSEDKELKLFP